MNQTTLEQCNLMQAAKVTWVKYNLKPGVKDWLGQKLSEREVKLCVL
ncbi:MAG TPA: hypothetical protein V6D34_00120 [Candidatus Sericytochromatia bacterium]